jgi:hypothetical protein
MDIFKRLQELDFPLGSYVVVGGGLLAALGIREARDDDVAVTSALFEELRLRPGYQVLVKYGKEFLAYRDADIIPGLDWEDYPTTVEEAIRSAEIIKGFPFLNLEETIKFKRAMGREKDFRDIALLEEYRAVNK